ncbi:MAG: hypothetical protein U0821_20610 [Chloroflexota bacterium]
MSPARTPADDAALRAQFQRELEVGGLAVPDDLRETLFTMWEDFLPQRQVLRTTELALPEEPDFMEKPPTWGVRP